MSGKKSMHFVPSVSDYINMYFNKFKEKVTYFTESLFIFSFRVLQFDVFDGKAAIILKLKFNLDTQGLNK